MFETKKDKQIRSKALYTVMLAATCGATLGLVGCSGMKSSTVASGEPSVALHGNVHGGQQPIVGASVYLYSVNTSYTGGPSTSMLSGTGVTNGYVTTDGAGYFTLPANSWSCTAGTYIYMVAIGGSPQVSGTKTNTNAAMLAGLGDCSNVNGSTFILLNEVTTVGSAFALSPFMTAYDHIGADTNGQAGLQRAFSNIAKLVNTANGQAATTLASGGISPHAKVYALANTLSACINTVNQTGGLASTACSNLFTYTTPSGGTAPTDTIMAAANIAKAPYQNVANLYGFAPTNPPFPNQLTGQPTDWALAVTYPGFNNPMSPAVDGSGNVFIADNGSNSVKIIPQAGASAITTVTNGLSAPSGIVIDASNNPWVINSSQLVLLNASSNYASTSFNPSNITSPTAIGIDPSGYIWVAGNGHMDRYSSSGAYQNSNTTGTNINAIVYNPY
jgi:hypothetical protein